MMQNKILPLASILSFVLFSCAPKPYADTNKIYNKQSKELSKSLREMPKQNIVADSLKQAPYWVGTVNFGLRKPNMVIIHHTAQNSCDQTLKTFTLERTQVSAHYVICKDGTLFHMLNDYYRAWHAGAGKWGGNTDINSSSIGIEIDNNGVDSFSVAQLNTLIGLLATLKKDYNIPARNFIGHGDIAPTRKNDPNVSFPWKEFAEKGYGLWYGDTSNVIVPKDFNDSYALRIIGYDISNLEAAKQAFRRHFLGLNIPGNFNEEEKKVLYLMMQKFL